MWSPSSSLCLAGSGHPLKFVLHWPIGSDASGTGHCRLPSGESEPYAGEGLRNLPQPLCRGDVAGRG